MARLIVGLVLISFPILELLLLIKSGQLVGFWATLAMVVAAGVLGAVIMSRQGVSVARRTREAIAQGRPPVGPVLDGAFLLLAGALLITPGFLTDVLGLALLVPPIRHKVSRWAVRSLVERAHVQLKVHEAQRRGGPAPSASRGNGAAGPIIEGEFERLGEKAREPHRGKDRDQL
jgi:UPF0716 protein FxsA